MIDQEATAREHVARLIADLSRSEAYPYPMELVALEETHISLAFLAGEFVYKVKKPVNFGFLDFSTLDQRRFFCEEELRLNRRLTDDVYLEVVPIVEVGGRLQFGGPGSALDYAVKMRRLPDDCMLRFKVDNDAAGDEILVALADRLTRFYAEAATGPGVDEWGTTDAVWRNIEENIVQSQPYAGPIVAPHQLSLIEEASRDFLRKNQDLFQARIEAGRIREGHGDLHLAHICVEGPRPEDLQIIDCLEFNPRLRCGDVAVDVAFLAMDLTYHGRPDLAARVVELLTERLRDPDLPRLVQYFSIYRAHVRAKVACFRSDELAPELPEFFVVRNEAARYFDLATSYIVEPQLPTLFMVGGLSGTGKSVISRRLARSLGAGLVSSDSVRLELAGRRTEDRRTVDYGTGIYTEEFTARTYETLFERARQQLEAGRSVVLDATFLNPRWREQARDLSVELGVNMLFVECQAPEDVVRSRLTRRAKELFESSEADWAIYQQQRERYGDSLKEVGNVPQVQLNTNQPMGSAFDALLNQLDLKRRI